MGQSERTVMQDVVVIGGGVIGLSTALQLAGRGARVTVLDAQSPGREASWAGAGILPPGHPGDPQHPFALLCRATRELWPALSADLRELTGVDNGYRRCGGITVASDAAADAAVAEEIQAWQKAGVCVEALTPDDFTALEPQLREGARGFRLPELCQVRNPRHLKALAVGCALRGVEIRTGQPVVEMEQAGERLRAVRTESERFEAESFLVAAGAWSQKLLKSAGCEATIVPVRGQIVLLSQTRPSIRHVLECGPCYLVPRPDGRMLVGSTEEWVGFDKRNTASAIGKLLAFAQSWVPVLAGAQFERAWAGLRPHAPDGVPYLGRVPQYRNLYVAAGHFRHGLNLSPITARLMSQVILGEPPDVPLDAFSLAR
jgi:glycine oxidase